eukprot:Cvel_2292.t3-p1 / transcript=Cvel_2292.t3 / gene=Cvel_2292 / organism=Chromera_velia_CCMP2878 / gene_product=Retrotransposable element Tf2 155 kDa protein type, putative / transcript_product=Retrotransposable element Tf2 155 kDa protein type, putative / location=Cvel_scaffold88:133801-135460(-) / protein_length=268 / sequence_SO=supercontig / SO=protein_coding / is_pseudo=false
MLFCEEYISIPHYREKALTIPACESPTGRDLLLLDSEEYPAEGEGEDFFSQRELRRLMKRPSSRVHLFRLEALRTEAKFLELVVDAKGVRPSHEKMQALTEFAQPTDRTSLRQFLGLANWFCRFVPRFSFLMGPLTFLLQGNVPFKWKTAQSRAFAKLKRAVQEHATLALPDPSKPVILVPDASQSAGAIGAVALQRDYATGRYCPLAFGSRYLTSTEAKYPVRELEFLAIVHFAKVWRHFLSSDSKIWTDHQSLTNFSHRSFEFCCL